MHLFLLRIGTYFNTLAQLACISYKFLATFINFRSVIDTFYRGYDIL